MQLWTVILPWGWSVGSETPLTKLVYCVTVAFTNLLPLNGDFSFGKSQKSQGVKSGLQWGLTDLGDVMLCQGSLQKSCRMEGALSWWSWSARSCHYECDGHTVHQLSQRYLTADWLAPWESDCSRMHSKVSSDWLPSYNKVMGTVLEIFTTAEYFPDCHRIDIDRKCNTNRVESQFFAFVFAEWFRSSPGLRPVTAVSSHLLPVTIQ